MISRRTFAFSGPSAAVLAANSSHVQAGVGWPTNIINIVVPFPTGGSVDQLARIVQNGLQQRLGVNVIVENKPGAQGSIGTGFVAHAKPDGATWVMVFDTHAVNPALQTLNFDTENDLDPVLLIGTSPHLLCTHPSRPYRSFAKLVEAAKKEVPGKLTYGTIGAGSLGHLTMVLLTKAAGIELTHVPYRGGGPLLNDALAGHVDFAIASTALVAPQVAAGSLVPLLQTGANRMSIAKDVPTAIEAGFENFESHAWWGVLAPKGTPEDLKSRMREAMVATFNEPAIRSQLINSMQITTKFGGPAELAHWIKRQIKVWGGVVRDNKIDAGQ